MFEKYDEEFAAVLSRKLEQAIVKQKWRQAMYGAKIADEWLDHHTPTEAREEYMAKLKMVEEFGGFTTDDDDGDSDDADHRVSSETNVITSDRSRGQILRLSTSSQSIDDSVPKLYGNKRRRNSGTDKEDKINGSISQTFTSTSQIQKKLCIIPSDLQLRDPSGFEYVEEEFAASQTVT